MKAQIGLRIILAFLTLTLLPVLPTQAAGLRRVRAIQTHTFQVEANTVIAVGTQRHAALRELKLGDRVKVAYVQENDALIARRIADGVPHKPSKPSTDSEQHKPQHHSQTSNLLHAHGVIQAIDLQASTVTIARRAK